MGLVPKTTTAAAKVVKSITLFRLLGLLPVFIFSLFLGEALCTKLGTVLLVIGNVIIYAVLSANDVVNPKKKFFNAYLAWLKKLVTPKSFFCDSSPEVIKYESEVAKVEEKKQGKIGEKKKQRKTDKTKPNHFKKAKNRKR